MKRASNILSNFLASIFDPFSFSNAPSSSMPSRDQRGEEGEKRGERRINRVKEKIDGERERRI